MKFQGFTLIELLVVIAIIILLTSLTLPYYRTGDQQLALQRSAHKLAQDLRMVQELAMSSKEINGVAPNGFGIHFKNSWPYSYILFANLNSNYSRDGADQDLETIQVEPGIIISNLSPSSSFSVLFVPPDPTVWINDSSLGTPAQITVSLEDDLAKTKIILVNNAGLIAVE